MVATFAAITEVDRDHMADCFERMAAVADTLLEEFSVGLGRRRSQPSPV
jgi:hypothetical protein